LNKQIEQRSFAQLELTAEQTDERKRLAGYGAVVEKPTVVCNIDGVDYFEVIDKNAFNNTDFSQCCLKYNHSDSYPIVARVKNKSLSLCVDNVGLRYEAALSDTTAANDLYIAVKEGLLDKSSFSFVVKRSEYDRMTKTRRILDIEKVYDVSVVDIPAYDDTSVEARNFFELQKSQEQLVQKEQKIKKLICRTYL